MDLSQYGINGSGGTSGTSAIPGLDGLQGMLGTITIISVVLGGLFMVLYVFSLVQRMRADRAMIGMHKDIAAIKEILEKHAKPVATTPQPSEPPAPAAAPIAPIEQ